MRNTIEIGVVDEATICVFSWLGFIGAQFRVIFPFPIKWMNLKITEFCFSGVFTN